MRKSLTILVKTEQYFNVNGTFHLLRWHTFKSTIGNFIYFG